MRVVAGFEMPALNQVGSALISFGLRMMPFHPFSLYISVVQCLG
jgi:hypothetical protein